MSTEFEDRISTQALTLQDQAADEEFEEEVDERRVYCSRCSGVIGKEVGYADDFGDGPICDNCLSDRTDELASYRG
jgi:hypothetical protein